MKDQKNKTLKESLEGLFDNNLPVENGDILQRPDDIEDESSVFFIAPYNKSESESKSKIKAKKVIISLLKLFMSEEIISNSEFIRAKTNLDAMSIEKILISINQIEYSIDIILREISTGMGPGSARVIEVFGQLQKTKVELIREYNSMINMFEESMRRYKSDLEFLDTRNSKKINTSGNIHRGNRELMKQIQQGFKDENSDSEEAEVIDFDE